MLQGTRDEPLMQVKVFHIGKIVFPVSLSTLALRVLCGMWYAMCDMRYVILICNVWYAIYDMPGSTRIRRQKRFSGLWVPVQWFASCVTRGFLVTPRSNPPRFLPRLTWNLIARCDLSSPHLTVRGEQRWFEAAGLGKPVVAKMDEILEMIQTALNPPLLLEKNVVNFWGHVGVFQFYHCFKVKCRLKIKENL